MSEFVRQMVDLALGAATVTRERAQAVVDELIKRGEVDRERGQTLTDELIEKGQQARAQFRAAIEERVEEALERLDLPRRVDVEVLTQRVAALERRLASLEQPT